MPYRNFLDLVLYYYFDLRFRVDMLWVLAYRCRISHLFFPILKFLVDSSGTFGARGCGMYCYLFANQVVRNGLFSGQSDLEA